MEISFDTLQGIISRASYRSTGAITEKQYCHYIDTDFPSFETFWKSLIVPFTNRICSPLVEVTGYTDPREGVSQDLQEIGSFHYAIFLNIVYAHTALEQKHFSFFENFYTHLGSICDLVEEFLAKVYSLILECEETESKILSKLSKDEFLDIAEKWYNKNYENLYEVYLKKGKFAPIKIPTRKYILSEYYGNSEAWKSYEDFSLLVRQYRNVIVHHYKIAFLQDELGNMYVPKKEHIFKYRSWNDVKKASQDENLQSDFILQDTQMTQDLKELKQVLQRIWDKPIQDLTNLLFINQNQKLLTKYNMTVV